MEIRKGGCRGLQLAGEVAPLDRNTDGESTKEENKAGGEGLGYSTKFKFHPVYVEE